MKLRYKKCVRCGSDATECPSATIGVMLTACQNPDCRHIERKGEPERESTTFAQIQREYYGVAMH